MQRPIEFRSHPDSLSWKHVALDDCPTLPSLLNGSHGQLTQVNCNLSQVMTHIHFSPIAWRTRPDPLGRAVSDEFITPRKDLASEILGVQSDARHRELIHLLSPMAGRHGKLTTPFPK
jgi:hypothetical protein